MVFWLDKCHSTCCTKELEKWIIGMTSWRISSAHYETNWAYERMKSSFYLYKMFADIQRWVSSCILCSQKNQDHHHHKDLLLGPWEPASAYWMRSLPVITLDNRYIIVIEDLITKFLEAVALPSIEANIITQVFWDNAIFCHGHPRRWSKLMKEVSYIINICKIFTSSYRLRCEGFIQPTNGTSTQVIAMHVSSNQKRL